MPPFEKQRSRLSGLPPPLPQLPLPPLITPTATTSQLSGRSWLAWSDPPPARKSPTQNQHEHQHQHRIPSLSQLHNTHPFQMDFSLGTSAIYVRAVSPGQGSNGLGARIVTSGPTWTALDSEAPATGKWTGASLIGAMYTAPKGPWKH